MTVDLRPVDPRSQERKRHGRIVAALEKERSALELPVEIDAAPIQTRRRSGLQTTPFEAKRFQRLGELL
jgi:hypothetical protein